MLLCFKQEPCKGWKYSCFLLSVSAQTPSTGSSAGSNINQTPAVGMRRGPRRSKQHFNPAIAREFHGLFLLLAGHLLFTD